MKIFIQGRICLFGEHSGWDGGYRWINANIEKDYALIVETNQETYADSHHETVIAYRWSPLLNKTV